MLNSKLTILLLAILCFPITAEAVCRLYVVNEIGVYGERKNGPRPNLPAGLAFTAHYWGRQGIIIVAADTTAGQHTTITGQAGAVALPDNLDAAIGAQLATVQNVFESRHIPGNWIQSTDTYRQVARISFHMFRIMQRFFGISGLTAAVIGQGGVTLNTQFGEMPQLRQDQLLQAIKDFFPAVQGISADTTLRQLFKQGADLFEVRPFTLGCMTI